MQEVKEFRAVIDGKEHIMLMNSEDVSYFIKTIEQGKELTIGDVTGEVSSYEVVDVKPIRENTHEEASKIALMYQERERNAVVVYDDPIKGRGQLTVNSVGIIDSKRYI